MGKKVKEFKAGDFIFAKVKGYPAWPARIQRLNGKKYFIYFYGTGETANLAHNVIFDYAENKDKFLNKTIKRKDFNDGVKQIEYDFANNISIEEVLGGPVADPADSSTANATAGDTTLDASSADTTANDTVNESAASFTATIETTAADSDDGALVIDEGKKNKKPMPAKASSTPKPMKAPKTPKTKKDDAASATAPDEVQEEIVSRSGRKIRPKRYADEQTEENATLPSPIPKKRRTSAEKETADKAKPVPPQGEKSKNYIAFTVTELEDIKETKAVESDKESIVIACLPSGQYVGVKLFQSVPTTFKSDDSKLNWYRQAASNALTLHGQLEKGHITAQSVSAQLETDLNLTDEEKSNLDKEREIEEKKLRVQFLKTEMKLIELDAKIKSCLSLEKADTELCLKLIDELMELDIKALMLLKHPTCLETVKRMRAYVGNTPSWELSEDEALSFTKHAHAIRKQADRAYKHFKELFDSPDGLSFWEFFSERVLQFKKCTQKLSADELLEMVHEPKELSAPSAITMRGAIDALNEKKDATPTKKRNTPAKKRAAAAAAVSTPTKEPSTKEPAAKETPSKATPKRQGRNKADKKTEESSVSKTEDSEVVTEGEKDDAFNNAVENFEKGPEKETEKKPTKKQEKANKSKVANKKKESNKKDSASKTSEKAPENKDLEKEADNIETEKVAENKDSEKVTEKVAETKEPEKVTENNDSKEKGEDKSTKETVAETPAPIEESKMDVDEPKTDEAKEVTEQNGEADKEAVESTETEKDSAVAERDDEPKSKRPRECNNKKSEPSTPTKTPTKRKSKS